MISPVSFLATRLFHFARIKTLQCIVLQQLFVTTSSS